MTRELAGLLCGLLLNAQASETLDVLVHSLDGAAEMRDGQLQPLPGGGMRAFNLALTQRLLASQPRPFTVREVPLNRGMQLLAAPVPALLVGTFRTPEREADYRWIGSLFSVDTLLYQDRRRPVAVCRQLHCRFRSDTRDGGGGAQSQPGQLACLTGIPAFAATVLAVSLRPA